MGKKKKEENKINWWLDDGVWLALVRYTTFLLHVPAKKADKHSLAMRERLGGQKSTDCPTHRLTDKSERERIYTIAFKGALKNE